MSPADALRLVTEGTLYYIPGLEEQCVFANREDAELAAQEGGVLRTDIECLPIGETPAPDRFAALEGTGLGRWMAQDDAETQRSIKSLLRQVEQLQAANVRLTAENAALKAGLEEAELAHAWGAN